MTLPPTGRTRRTAPVNSGEMGWVVTVHLERPIGADRPRVAQCQHWTGWLSADRLVAGLAEITAGTHCRVLAAATRLGIGYDIAGIEWGDRNRERQLKQRSTTRRCFVCRCQRRWRRAAEQLENELARAA